MPIEASLILWGLWGKHWLSQAVHLTQVTATTDAIGSMHTPLTRPTLCNAANKRVLYKARKALP
jgi:hypothetical protein